MVEAWREGRLLFGKMWEDPASEIALLRLQEKRHRATKSRRPLRVLSVASSGDTAFSLAAHTSEPVTAVDLNPAQIHFCRLKQALLEHLNTEEICEILYGDATVGMNRVLPFLPETSQKYWLGHSKTLRRGLHLAGRVDRSMDFLRRLFQTMVTPPARLFELLEQSDLESQRTTYQRHWNSWKWRLGLKVALHPWVLSLIYGREMVAALPSNAQKAMADRMERFVCDSPARHNPYLWQTFAGRYRSLQDVPAYLENFGEVNFFCADITERLEAEPDCYDLFTFSNILEVSDSGAALRLMRAAQARANPGALFCFRFMLERPTLFPEQAYRKDLSRMCHQKDRAFFCNHFQVYEKRP